MAKLIVDLRNEGGKLVDTCGNTWRYYGSSSTDIPSDLIVNFKRPGYYGFKTGTDSRFVEMNSFGTIWDSASYSITTWTINCYYYFDPNKHYNAWCLVVPNVKPVLISSGAHDIGMIDGKPRIFAFGAINGGFSAYSYDNTGYYNTTYATQQIINTSKFNQAKFPNQWKRMTFIYQNNKQIDIYNNGILYCKLNSTTDQQGLYIYKQAPIRLGGWPNYYTTQTGDIPYYKFQVYEGVQYPDIESEEDSLKQY